MVGEGVGGGGGGSSSNGGGGEEVIGDAELTSVERKHDCLEVEFDKRHTFRLPYIWLRDSCPRAFDPKTGERIFSVAYSGPHMPSDTLAALQDASHAIDAGIERRVGYSGLVVVWNGGIESRFQAGWLLNRCAGRRAELPRALMGPERRSWGREDLPERMATFSFREVTGDDKACVQLLEAVAERDGVAIITGVPCRHGSVADVSRRVLGSGHVNRPFTFKAGGEMDAHSGAVLEEQALHSELAYCVDSPGIMVILCVKGGSGGADGGGNLVLVDGLTLAQELKQGHPDEYSLLSSNALTFRRTGTHSEFDLMASRPAITLDAKGSVVRMCIDEQHRTRWEEDAQVGGSVLSAMQVALGLLHSDGLVVPVSMSAGDMLLIDANRVLWGQTPFGAAGGGSYEAGFVSMDDAISRARVLRRHMPEN